MKNLKNKTKKKGFTLIEVLAAIVISSLSIFVMTQISVNATNLAVKNKAADRATQIYSATSQILLNLKPQNSFPGGLYCTAGTAPSYPQYSAIDVYLAQDPVSKVITISNSSGAYALTDRTPTQEATLKATPKFVQDSALSTEDKANGYERSTVMLFNPTYNTLTVQISIFWNIYGQDNYYTNYNILNVGECAP